MKTESKGKSAGNCCDGKLKKVSGDKLTTSCAEGDEHNYTVAKDAKVDAQPNVREMQMKIKQGKIT